MGGGALPAPSPPEAAELNCDCASGMLKSVTGAAARPPLDELGSPPRRVCGATAAACRQSPANVCTRGRSLPRSGLQHAVHLGLLGRTVAAGCGGGGGCWISAGSVVTPGSTPGSVAAPLAMTPGGDGSTAGFDVAVLVAVAPATAPVASPAEAPCHSGDGAADGDANGRAETDGLDGPVLPAASLLG